MKNALFGTFIAIGLALAGAAQAERLTDKPLVDAQWLAQNLDNDKLVILDIRDLEKTVNPYVEGHVPGAISAQYSKAGWRATVNDVPGMLPPKEEIEKLIESLGIDNDSHVVIVPAGANASEFGGGTRVYWTFKVLGHDAVSILDGGYAAWTKAGNEVSREATVPTRTTDFTANFRPELLAEVKEVQDAIASDTNLVDARSVAQFIGQEKTPTVKTLGTVPTAVNVNFDKFYHADKPGFASAEEIAQLSDGVSASDGRGIITFCNTGHLASIAWFGLSEVQGLKNVRLYDGSMAEWTVDSSRPVVIN